MTALTPAPAVRCNTPIEVDFLPALYTGRGFVGLTICPGKQDTRWDRNLDVDLQRMVRDLRVDGIVCLLTKPEAHKLGVPLDDYKHRANMIGLEWVGLPIVDNSFPRDTRRLEATLARMEKFLGRRDFTWAVHCMGGLGRAGTLSALLLVRHGLTAKQAINVVRAARPGAIQTAGQEGFIFGYAARHRREAQKSA